MLKEFIEKLKLHLKESETEYHQVNSWVGNTEDGFYTEHNFDFDALLKEIDKFSETFNKENGNA